MHGVSMKSKSIFDLFLKESPKIPKIAKIPKIPKIPKIAIVDRSLILPFQD